MEAVRRIDDAAYPGGKFFLSDIRSGQVAVRSSSLWAAALYSAAVLGITRSAFSLAHILSAFHREAATSLVGIDEPTSLAPDGSLRLSWASPGRIRSPGR